MRVARLSRVVRTIALVSLVVGLAGEAFDRLWTVRVLESFSLPDVAGLDGEVVWFTAIALAGTLVSLVVSLVVNRAAPRLVGAEHPTWLLASLVGLQVVFVLAVALGGSLWLVLAALWGRSAAGVLAAPIRSAWLNRNLSSGTRATMISMTSQLDAVGQVVGGPPSARSPTGPPRPRPSSRVPWCSPRPSSCMPGSVRTDPARQAGSRTVKVVSPGRLSRETDPPCAWATAATMDRPSPVLPAARLREVSPRANRWKTSAWSSGGTPGPLSRTVSRTWSSSRTMLVRTTVPGAVCVRALPSRLATIW